MQWVPKPVVWLYLVPATVGLAIAWPHLPEAVRNFGVTDLGKGFEPDSSFYFRNAAAIRAKDDDDLTPDPAPELVIEVDGILDLWREPVPLLQTRDLGVRERGRVTSALGIPDGAVGFLASLAVGAGLIAVEEPPARARGRRGSRRPR